MKRSSFSLFALLALFACSPTEVAAPTVESPRAPSVQKSDSGAAGVAISEAGMWVEPDPGDGWLNPLGRGGGWGMLPSLGGTHCGPAGQWATNFPNPNFPGIPGIQVTATANCTPDPFPSDDAILDWLRRVNAQRREWVGAGWSPFGSNADPTNEEAQYCRARVGQAPSAEEFADIVEWAELACPPCWAALVLAFEAWGAWQTAGAIVEVGQRLLAEGKVCGREAVLLAVGAVATLTRGSTGPVGHLVWNRIAPNGVLLGTKVTNRSRDVNGGLAAAESLMQEMEVIFGRARQLKFNAEGQPIWFVQAADGTSVNFRHFTGSVAAPALGFSIPGKPGVVLKFIP